MSRQAVCSHARSQSRWQLSVSARIKYWRRIFSAYLTSSSSQLTFWLDQPTAEEPLSTGELGKYYMRFVQKAHYTDLLDGNGVPMLDYRGATGPQYNPIAVAQFALGNHTLWIETQDPDHLSKCIVACDWLAENLEPNDKGVPVWQHKFDWEYVQTLQNPWYSGLAQGQGISALLRCHAATGDPKYLDAAKLAFRSFHLNAYAGGVLFEDGQDLWIEEYIVDPPSHILNGFIWALWGVRDHQLVTGDSDAAVIWDRCIGTLERNLSSFDLGYWSLYDQSSRGRLKMIASNFYHRLHIVQLRIMWQLTGMDVFLQYSQRWDAYTNSRSKRWRSRAGKALFKLLRY